MSSFYIRKARVQDVPEIHHLLSINAEKGLLLPRTYAELYSHLRDLFVVAPSEDGDIVGCCGLSIMGEDLAEIRSLAVGPSQQGHGWGKKLVEACLSEAVTLGLFRIFTLTYQVDFFDKLGFTISAKEIMPQKIWSDCVKCPKFPACDETLMLLEV